ncbi:hypothetical protein EDC90_10446 [Martelella mediterranea]|uniref:Uncharacterized protein n=1 Tax=Martelella mediterranea TaxID=293089 RepID=A0A4R3NKZ2_9HYPH|nr:hypothetical protein EDC90_10446 [Martelella mediterranea]
MSRVSTAIAVTGFLFSGASLAEDYRCASFANDVYGQDAGEASSSYKFAVSRGIVDGVFVASQRSPLAVSQDQTRGQFRRAVAVRCSSHPDETVENAALTVSGLLPDASEYRSMAPLDFNLAKSSIVGTKVSLSGDLSVGSDSATLYSDEMNTNSIKIDISQLAQTDREYLTENCTGLCQITINGAVSKFNFSEGLKAESIAHE